MKVLDLNVFNRLRFDPAVSHTPIVLIERIITSKANIEEWMVLLFKFNKNHTTK